MEMNPENFKKLPTTQAGMLGEKLAIKLKEKEGYIIYPYSSDGPHILDIFVFKAGEGIHAIDVKTKPARRFYPDTGIDLYFYNRYKEFQDIYNMDVELIFVDSDKAEIYGGYLNVLDDPREIKHNGWWLDYPLDQASANKFNAPANLVSYTTRYWPLEAMSVLGKITPAKVKKLKELSQRDKRYSG